MELVRGCILLIISLPFKMLTFRSRKFKASIYPGMFEGKPVLHCDFGNNDGTQPMTVTDCQLMVDNQLIRVPFRNFGMSLPWIVEINNGFGYTCDPIPLVTKARELGQERFTVSAWYQDSADRVYVSKPLTIETESGRFIRLFEDEQDHDSEPARLVWNTAKEIANQLDQQLVGIPHIVLALVREQNGVGGAVLRELGLDEQFLLDLAKTWPNLPRDRQMPEPYLSTEANKLGDFTQIEAGKMHQRCFGTGHLLLGLARQKDKAFRVILKHLGVRPRQLRVRIYDELRKDQNQLDHPTPPPKGVERYVWAIGYPVAHTTLIVGMYALLLIFPDADF